MWNCVILVILVVVNVLNCQTKQCFKNEDASWEIKKWILTEISEEDKTKIKFYETDMSFIKYSEGPSWYIVGDGWQAEMKMVSNVSFVLIIYENRILGNFFIIEWGIKV